MALMQQSLGFETYGVEAFCPNNSFEKRHNLNIFHGTLREAKFPDDHFDVITILHVLEHVPDPRGEIKEMKRVLKAGGRLIIGGPNSDSLLRYTFGRHWANLDVPRHLSVPSVSNLKKLGNAEGLTLRSIRYYGGAEHLIRTLMNVFGHPQPMSLGRGAMLAGLPIAYALNFLRVSDVAEVVFTK
jgi:SAM-dependent methyltransferase